MKKILLLSVAVILCVFATSCTKNNPYNYVPEGAEAVMVFDLGATPNQSIDMDQLNKILVQDTCYLSAEQKALIKEFAADPKQMGLNLLKKFVVYSDVEEGSKGDITVGVVIPVIFEKNVTSSFNKINKKVSWCNFKSIKKEGDISYIYPLENEESKNDIIGWNGKMFVWLTSTRDLTPADIKTAFNRDRKTSILVNDDFCSFKSKCKTLSVWMRCDAALTVLQAIDNGRVDSYSKWAGKAKKDLKENKEDFERNHIKFNHILAVVDDVQALFEGLHDSYVHAYYESDKKSCTTTVSYVWSDKISNYDYAKVMDEIIASGILKVLFAELVEEFDSSDSSSEEYGDYSYDDFEEISLIEDDFEEVESY